MAPFTEIKVASLLISFFNCVIIVCILKQNKNRLKNLNNKRLIVHCTDFLMAASSKLRPSKTGFPNITMSSLHSAVTRSQWKRAPLGCCKSPVHISMIRTGDSYHGCAADKPATAQWYYHVSMDQNIWKMFPAPCTINNIKNFGRSEGKSGS